MGTPPPPFPPAAAQYPARRERPALARPQRYNVQSLVDEDDPLAVAAELDAVRAVLLEAGGQLQALFTYFATGDGSGAASVADFERLRLSALQQHLLNTRITGAGFREAALEDVLKRAQALGAARLVLLGGEEWAAGKVRVKLLATREEVDVPADALSPQHPAPAAAAGAQ